MHHTANTKQIKLTPALTLQKVWDQVTKHCSCFRAESWLLQRLKNRARILKNKQHSNQTNRSWSHKTSHRQPHWQYWPPSTRSWWCWASPGSHQRWVWAHLAPRPHPGGYIKTHWKRVFTLDYTMQTFGSKVTRHKRPICPGCKPVWV